ncbi:MAG: OmpA family protein [Pseudolabrys sp.]
MQPNRPAAPPPPAAQAPLPTSPLDMHPNRPAAPPPPAAQAPLPTSPRDMPQNRTASPQPPQGARAPQGNRPASAPPPPPTQPRSANDFIRRNDQGPNRGFDEIRRDRREVRDGNRTIITEGDRTIVRDGDRTIIRHNEADRFAIDARDVRVTRRGNDMISIIVRPDGSQIVSTTDPSGRLLRRVRRDRNGREVIIIDNRFAGPPRNGYFIDVPPPPRYAGPADRYILDSDRADRDAIFSLFMAPPISRLDRRYTLDDIRYSQPLRSYMPRVDLDVNFESGSWQLTPEQVDKLAAIADGINRAVSRNPREVFLIEGHTDAVGSDDDNLSLSDRRAEAVAVALTERFQVPPENLVTQGYGEQDLRVPTDGPSRENRRVAVRRITPLIDRNAAR